MNEFLKCEHYQSSSQRLCQLTFNVTHYDFWNNIEAMSLDILEVKEFML